GNVTHSGGRRNPRRYSSTIEAFVNDLAQMVGSEGRVVGADIDETKLQLARQEAEAQKRI
ncbi:MAG TPA: hypothetical protein VFA32_19430, partial [Dehalococcoidia bacterium]|nr:hypothetical protein [Dehalococcoidia bacterium]